VTISKSLEETRKCIRVKSTKSGKARRLSLPVTALEALRKHRDDQQKDRTLFGESYRDTGLVFCKPDGTFLRPDAVSCRVTELIRKTGLPAGISLHTLRHSHASLLLSKREPLPAVSARLGHASPAITLSIYSHVTPQDEEKLAQTWDDFISRKV
jgi:integrase